MEIKQTDLAWLAGIIDGEGSIGVGYRESKNSYQTQIQLENTNVALMDRAVSIAESVGVNPRLTTRVKNQLKNPKWKVSYRYCITKHSEIELLLQALIPHLTAKKAQAILLLEWVQDRQSLGRSPRGHLMPHTEKSKQIYQKLKEINKNGTEVRPQES
jgi:hypothetical protein